MSELKFFDNDTLVIGGGDWELAPFKFSKYLKIGGGTEPSYIDIIISGTTSVTLTNAKADGLNYVKLFGGTEQRNLPSGYTQVDGITGDGSAYINLNTTLNQDDEIEIVCQIYNSTTGENILGYRNGASSNNIMVFFSGTPNTIVLDFNNSDYATYRLMQLVSTNTIYKIIINKNKRAIYTLDGTLVAENTTTCSDTISTGNIYLFSANGLPSSNKLFNGTIYSCLIKGKRNLIPCKNSNNEVGMYDTVSGTFFGNVAESGSFTAGNNTVPSPSTPIDIVSNNGVIKYSPNLVNMVADNVDLGHYISANGVYSESVSNFLYVPYIKVQPNTTYTLSFSDELYYITISEYSANDGTGFIQRNAGTTGGNTSLTVTTQATTQYIRFGSNPYGNSNTVTLEQVLAINWMLAKADTPQTYIPYGIYTDGTVETVKDSLNNTATAEMLLKVGDYSDEQEVLTGAITRNIGIKVLDGTETWTKATLNFYADIVSDAIHKTHTCFCTHYTGIISNGSVTLDSNSIKVSDNSGRDKYWNRVLIYAKRSDYATAQDFKDYLASEYAKGTPVIIVYPLATATTETVTGQTLTTQSGTNIIEITQASINNLPLEVSYKGTT